MQGIEEPWEKLMVIMDVKAKKCKTGGRKKCKCVLAELIVLTCCYHDVFFPRIITILYAFHFALFFRVDLTKNYTRTFATTFTLLSLSL